MNYKELIERVTTITTGKNPCTLHRYSYSDFELVILGDGWSESYIFDKAKDYYKWDSWTDGIMGKQSVTVPFDNGQGKKAFYEMLNSIVSDGQPMKSKTYFQHLGKRYS